MLRILHPKLHRSLPELDVLADRRRRSVVRWALRSRGTGALRSRAGRWSVTLGATLAAAGVGFVAMVAWIAHEHLGGMGGYTAQDAWEDFTDSFLLSDDWGYVLTAMLPVVLVFGATRRLMNRSAVRQVLRRRGRCDKCGYGLNGMPVGEGDGVKCPECAALSGLMPEGDELGEGRVFRPRSDLVAARFWTARRVKRVAVAVVSIAAVWGGSLFVARLVRHARIDADARAAEADCVTAKEYLAVVQPTDLPVVSAGEGGEGDAWELIISIAAGIKATGAAEGAKNEAFADAAYDLSMAGPGPVEGGENMRVWAEYGTRVLEAWLPSGHDSVERLARRSVVRSRANADAEGRVAVWGASSHLADARSVARLGKGLMRYAVAADDPDAWRLGALLLVRTAEASERDPTMIGRLVANAIDNWLAECVRERLFDLRAHAAGGARAARWLDAIEGVLAERARRALPVVQTIRGERLFMRDMVAKRFANAAGVKDGSVEESLRNPTITLLGGEGRFGRYGENRDALASFFTWFEGQAVKPRWEREKSPPVSGLLCLDLLEGSVDSCLLPCDGVEQHLIATRAMAAIERHRQRTGAYPERLAEVAPAGGGAGFIDLFDRGGPLRYRRTTTKDGALSYLLYSVGWDGVDGGGEVTWLSAGLGRSTKADAVFSEPEPGSP